MKAKGGSWSNKGGRTGPNSGKEIKTDIGRAAVWESKGRAWNCQRRCSREEGKEKGTKAKVGRIGSMESPRRVVRRTEEHDRQYFRNFGHPRTF